MHPVSVVIDTFVARREVGQPLAAGFDRVRRRFVEPLLGAHARLQAWFELQPTHDLGRPTSSSWRRLEELVRDGAVDYCSVEVRGDARSTGYFHFGAKIAHELVTDVPHTITMHAHPTLFGSVPGFDLTHEVEALAKQLAVSVRASAGYVACHLALAKNGEEQRGGDTTAVQQLDLRTHLRGCYWGNFLSALHLEALGGGAHVAAACPAAAITNLTREDHELVFVGLSGNPCDDQGYALLELERFFEPLLTLPEEEPVSVGLDLPP